MVEETKRSEEGIAFQSSKWHVQRSAGRKNKVPGRRRRWGIWVLGNDIHWHFPRYKIRSITNPSVQETNGKKKKGKKLPESPAIYVNHQPLVRVSAPGNTIPGHKLRVEKT